MLKEETRALRADHSALLKRTETPESTTVSLANSASPADLKMADLEDRSHRNNICSHGLPEGSEGTNTLQYLTKQFCQSSPSFVDPPPEIMRAPPLVLASYSSHKKSRGVLVVGRRNLPLTILDTGYDEEARVAYVRTMMGNNKIALISVYAPNSHDQNFFDSFTLLDLSEFRLIDGGDFNAVWEHQMDRTGLNELREQRLTSSSLHRWASVSIIDSWRLVNPSFREYTFHSARHKSFSGIDYIFISLRTLLGEFITLYTFQ